MTSTAEYIRRAITRNKQVNDAIRNKPNDQELGSYVRELFRYDRSIHIMDEEQLGKQNRLNFPEDDETFLTQYEYKRRNWLGK